MHQTRFGLSVSEHLQAAGLIARVRSGLQGLLGMVKNRYPADHPIQTELNHAEDAVQAARIELENTARSEHPRSGLVYPINLPRTSDATLEHAVAGSGDGVGEID